MYLLEKALAEKPVEVSSLYMGKSKEGDWVRDDWAVVLKYQGRSMSTEFHTGVGLRKNNKPVPPKVPDVLYCLLMDSSALDLTFEEWCSEMGYDTDSRKAEKIYNLCVENAIKVKRLLGKDFQYFMDNNEY